MFFVWFLSLFFMYDYMVYFVCAFQRDSRRLPHPPRRKPSFEENKLDEEEMISPFIRNDINMLHFVVSCLNWKCEAKYNTLRVELLTNGISPIPNELYQNTIENANKLINHPMNNKYEFSVDEIAVIKLYCDHYEFSQNVRYIIYYLFIFRCAFLFVFVHDHHIIIHP